MIKCTEYFLDGQISAWAFSDLFSELYRKVAQGRPEEVELAIKDLFWFCEDWDLDETDGEKFRNLATGTLEQLKRLWVKYEKT